MIIDGDATVKENGSAPTKGAEVDIHVAQDDANTQANENVDDSGQESDIDGGATDSEAGEPGQESSSETGSEAGQDDPVALIQQQIQALNQKLETMVKPQPAPIKELSEEEWTAKEAQFGVGRQTIKAIAEQNVYVYNRLKEEMMDELDKRMGGFEKSNALQSLTKDPKFSDAPKYQKEVDDFLKDFDSRHHSNPELLKRAVIYSRGLNVGNTINKIRNEGERNRMITGVGKPSSPNGGMRNRVVPLTPLQKKYAEKMGEEEYRKFMPRLNGAVLIEK